MGYLPKQSTIESTIMDLSLNSLDQRLLILEDLRNFLRMMEIYYYQEYNDSVPVITEEKRYIFFHLGNYGQLLCSSICPDRSSKEYFLKDIQNVIYPETYTMSKFYKKLREESIIYIMDRKSKEIETSLRLAKDDLIHKLMLFCATS